MARNSANIQSRRDVATLSARVTLRDELSVCLSHLRHGLAGDPDIKDCKWPPIDLSHHPHPLGKLQPRTSYRHTLLNTGSPHLQLLILAVSVFYPIASYDREDRIYLILCVKTQGIIFQPFHFSLFFNLVIPSNRSYCWYCAILNIKF